MPPATARKSRKAVVGSPRPRIGPPRPLRADIKAIAEVAAARNESFYPWQETAARYIESRGPNSWTWPEVAVVVARQNGKTSVLEDLVVSRLRRGMRVMHTAQNRELPRESHAMVADLFVQHWPRELERVRYAAGQEEVSLKNGGHYRIVAPTKAGARGYSNDLVLIDEVLDFENFDFISAAKPTTMASGEAQIVYFSNAGTPESVVLNSLKQRADNDPALAYLEWSAPPDASPDDLKAWLAANPAVGHNLNLLPNLEREYRSHVLGSSLGIWERENLCRWTPVIGQPTLIADDEWERQQFGLTDEPGRYTTLGIKMDPSGTRASAVAAWPAERGVNLALVAEVTGDPIDVELLGPELAKLAVRTKARKVVFDPWTDGDLARYFRKPEAVGGRDWANASEKFVRLALGRQFNVRDPDGILARDLGVTVRVSHTAGTYAAAKATPEATNTAVEAAIRAAWVASAPMPKVVVY